MNQTKLRMDVLEDICTKANLLTHLYMANCHLKGALCPGVATLVNLKVLDLSDNRIRHIPWVALNGLPRLTVLDLSINYITDIPTSIGGIQTLSKLHLSHNQLLHLPTEIALLENLKLLDVSNNLLREIPAMMFAGPIMLSLVTLRLRNNLLDELPVELGLLTELEELDIEDNNLTRLPKSVKNLTKIQVLHFKGNKWGPLVPNECIAKKGEVSDSSYGVNALERLYTLINSDKTSTDKESKTLT